MMENKAHALAAGTFVLLVLGLLVALAAWLTRDAGLHHVYELSTREAVTGLQPQAAVRYRGIAVGKVLSIGFDPASPGGVLVRISLNDGVPVTGSTYATLGFQGVTGLAFVQLDDTDESKVLLKTDGDVTQRIPLRPGLLSKLTDQGAGILMQVDETTRRLNQLLSVANQKVLVGALGEMGQAAGGVSKLAASLDATLTQKLDPALAALPALASDAGKTLQSLQGAGQEIAKSASAVGQAAQRLGERQGPLDKLGESADALTGAVASFNAATLPRVNRAGEDAARAARQLGRTAGALSDNPQSLLFGHGAVPPGPGEAGFVAPGAGQ